jgi:hypothetical protein
VSENGKDIIAVDENNIPCGFQLMTGNITASKWRSYHGEVVELIELPIVHPNIDVTKQHRPVLVTNGKISDDVRLKITDLNRGNESRKLPPLEIIAQEQLLKMFVDAQGSFLPNEPDELRDFLKLYTSNGEENIEERQFANFILGNLDIMKSKSSKNCLARQIATTLLLVKYALSPYERKDNYISLVKGWTIFLAHVYLAAEKHGLQAKHWKTSIDLGMREILYNLESFRDEVKKLNNVFLQGDNMGDGGVVYQTRTTLTVAWLAAFELINKWSDAEYGFDEDVLKIVEENYPSRLFLWGESAVVCFLALGLLFSYRNDDEARDRVYHAVLNNVVLMNNSRNGKGLANPYYSPDSILAAIHQMPDSEIDFASFVGTSYSLKTLVECLARSNRRELLDSSWYMISYTFQCEFVPQNAWQTLLWENENGSEIMKSYALPQSWHELMHDSKSDPLNVPDIIRHNKPFVLLFLLTYPHRLRSDLFKLLDKPCSMDKRPV